MSILVKDMIMGSSKTTNMIKEINKRTKEDKERPLLIVVPLKSEVKRFMEYCPNENLFTPKNYYSTDKKRMINKKENILELLTNGRSIVTTHSLFSLFSNEIESEIERQEYIIIIDEEIVTIEPLYMTKDTYTLLFNDSQYASINPVNNRVEWTGPLHDNFDVKGIKEYRDLILSNRVISFSGSTGHLFVVETPVSFFSLSDKYIILTYMFECSDLCSFFKMYNIDYEVQYQDPVLESEAKRKFKELITFVDPPRSVKKIADKRKTNFSSTHYDNSIKTDFMIQLRDTLGKSLKRQGVTKDEFLYACKKNISCQAENKIKGRHLTPKGYHGCWIPYNCKATNDYSHKTYIVFMHNVYRNVHVSKYLKSMVGNGALTERTVKENEDYSLSILLQCIWRTAIRNNEPIKVMIFSNRMKALFEEWLDNK